MIPFLQGGAPSGGLSWIFLPAMLIVFYFFLIRPQQKKAKEQTLFLDNMQKGDKVVTMGGIHGKIVGIDQNDMILLQIDEGTKIKINKAAISQEYTKALIEEAS